MAFDTSYILNEKLPVNVSGALPQGQNMIGFTKNFDMQWVSIPKDMVRIVHMLADGRNLYIIAENNGGTRYIYTSLDEGNTWGSSNLYTYSKITRLVKTNDGSILAIGHKVNGNDSDIGYYKRNTSGVWSDWTVFDTIVNNKILVVGSASTGKMGTFFSIYQTKRVYRTTDNGATWTNLTIPDAMAKAHVHCVYADPYRDAVYATTGDSPEGQAGAVKTTDFTTWTHIYKERAGMRVVPLTGTEQRRYLGLESTSGGILSSADDVEWDLRMGKVGSEYLHFDCLVALPEGTLIAGTYQYGTYPSKRFSSGGSVFISNDEGLSFSVIKTQYINVSSITYNDTDIFIGFGFAIETQNSNGLKILKIPRKLVSSIPPETTVYKVLAHNGNNGEIHILPPNSTTLETDVTKYKSFGLLVDTENTGTIVLQGSPFYDYTREDNWFDVETIEITAAGKRMINLSPEKQLFARYRFKNTGTSSLNIKTLTIVCMS